MDTEQNSTSTSAVMLTPEMCRAVLAEIEVTHRELTRDEETVFERHVECNGFGLVAAQIVRCGILGGLPHAEFLAWAGRWADKAEHGPSTFEERRAVAKIRAYAVSMDRLDVDDRRDEDERIELEHEVCGLRDSAPCVATKAWSLVFEAAIWMRHYRYQEEPEDAAALAGEITVRLMGSVCSRDEERECMVDDLRALVAREREIRVTRARGEAFFTKHIALFPAGSSCPQDFSRGNADAVRVWNTSTATGEIAQGFIRDGGNPWLVVDVLLEAIGRDPDEEAARLLRWTQALRRDLWPSLSEGELLEEMLDALFAHSFELHPNESYVLGLAARVARGSSHIGEDAAVVVRELMHCGAFGGCGDGGELSERGAALVGALRALRVPTPLCLGSAA